MDGMGKKPFFQRFPHRFPSSSSNAFTFIRAALARANAIKTLHASRDRACVPWVDNGRPPAGDQNTGLVDFNYVYFSSRTLGEMMQFDEYFSDRLKPPTRHMLWSWNGLEKLI